MELCFELKMVAQSYCLHCNHDGKCVKSWLLFSKTIKSTCIYEHSCEYKSKMKPKVNMLDDYRVCKQTDGHGYTFIHCSNLNPMFTKFEKDEVCDSKT